MHAIKKTLAAAAALCLAAAAQAAPAFVNALVLDGAAVDASGGTALNDRAAARSAWPSTRKAAWCIAASRRCWP